MTGRLGLAPAIAILVALLSFAAPARATVVGYWNNIALGEIRAAKFGPPIVARALAVAHTCMYDAWTAYDARAVGTVVGGTLRRPASERNDANKATAISFAAYRCLLNLFPSGGARLAAAMRALGYDPNDASTNLTTPTGIGNFAASAVIASRRNDGSNQYGDLAPGAYADYTGYYSRNPPLAFCTPLTPGHCFPNVADPYHWQPIVSDAGVTQVFIAPFWERVRPFALASASQYDRPDIAPPPNFLRGFSNYLADIEEMIQFSASLDEPKKLIVEYWADGPASELPPGHWGLFAQFVSQRDNNTIDEDVLMFFAMHNASFDAGIVAWHLKRLYDGVRPITAVRYIKQLSQIFAWGGPGRPSELIPGEKWTPYNPGSNLTPAFPGYISGHSTFSSASATVLRSFTGSDNFGFSTVLPPNFGRVEPNIPPVPTTFTYPTFSSAAAEAGLSRLLGGIHFSDDNVVGQRVGALVGQQAWAKAQFLADGGLGVDSTNSTMGDNAKMVSWSHTVGARSNRLLLVGLTYRDGNPAITGVSYGGVALSQLLIQSGPANQNRVELWYLLSPPMGTSTVAVSLSKAKDIVAGSISFTGIDQSAPFGGLQSAIGQSKTACVTVVSTSAQLIASVLVANGDAKSVSAGAGQTVAWNTGTGTGGGDVRSFASTIPGMPQTNVCETLQSDKPWALVSVSLRPSIAF